MTQTQTQSQPTFPSPFVRHVVRPMTRVLNPAMRRLAGRRHPALARLEHRGRRSGREHVTPVSARLTGDTFVVPLTFGDQSDWCRNVLDAGSCSIRWQGRDHRAVSPRVVDRHAIDQAMLRSAFNAMERTMFRVLRVTKFLLLDDA
jgi:deazaflavin-dependent oxidoreductase (nitroreductase family)